MGDVLQFRPRPLRRSLVSPQARGDDTTLPAFCATDRDAGSIGDTPEMKALQHAAWHTDLSDPDLIAFAKSGGPTIDDVTGC